MKKRSIAFILFLGLVWLGLAVGAPAYAFLQKKRVDFSDKIQKSEQEKLKAQDNLSQAMDEIARQRPESQTVVDFLENEINWEKRTDNVVQQGGSRRNSL